VFCPLLCGSFGFADSFLFQSDLSASIGLGFPRGVTRR
jgi:hypothetical protein